MKISFFSAILGFMIAIPCMPAFAGTEGSGGGDALLLDSHTIRIVIEKRLAELLDFRIRVVTAKTRSALPSELADYLWAGEPSAFSGDLARAKFRSVTCDPSDAISASAPAIQLDANSSWRFCADRILARHWTFSQLLLETLRLSLSDQAHAEPKDIALLSEELLEDWFTAREVPIMDKKALQQAIKTRLKPSLAFLTSNIVARNLELLPDELRAPIAQAAIDGLPEFIKDIQDTKYELSDAPLFDVAHELKDAITLHERSAKVRFNAQRILERHYSLGDLARLAFHEHARHFGIHDDDNRVSVLVDRQFAVTLMPRSGEPDLCRPREAAYRALQAATRAFLAKEGYRFPEASAEWVTGGDQIDLDDLINAGLMTEPMHQYTRNMARPAYMASQFRDWKLAKIYEQFAQAVLEQVPAKFSRLNFGRAIGPLRSAAPDAVTLVELFCQ